MPYNPLTPTDPITDAYLDELRDAGFRVQGTNTGGGCRALMIPAGRSYVLLSNMDADYPDDRDYVLVGVYDTAEVEPEVYVEATFDTLVGTLRDLIARHG
jgi:hypothetical protein